MPATTVANWYMPLAANVTWSRRWAGWRSPRECSLVFALVGATIALVTAHPPATTPAARPLWPWAAATTLATLLLLAVAVLVATFAPGLLVMLALVALPLTVGLPTTLAALACVWLEVQPLHWLLAASLALGFLAQYAAMRATRWLRQQMSPSPRP